MRKLLLVMLCLPVLAQSQSLLAGKNTLKWNLSSLALNNYHFTYERSIMKHVSLSLSYRTMAKGPIPYADKFRDQLNSNDINFDNFQIGNTAITPELRFYFSLKRMKGFYIAPYARFASFDLSVPVKYDNGTPGAPVKEALMTGKITSTSGGILLGYQFNIARKLILDFQIIGGHYGTSKGTLDFPSPTPLSPSEQQVLRDHLNSITADPFKFKSTVTANGAVVASDGPWAGIRGLNLGLGIRF